MSKRSRPSASPLPATKEETTSLGYARPPADACEEAAMRLNVVIRMLTDHDCPAGQTEPEARDDDEGGYDIAIIRSAVKDIRDMLRLSVRADAAEQTARNAGGAQ